MGLLHKEHKQIFARLKKEAEEEKVVVAGSFEKEILTYLKSWKEEVPEDERSLSDEEWLIGQVGHRSILSAKDAGKPVDDKAVKATIRELEAHFGKPLSRPKQKAKPPDPSSMGENHGDPSYVKDKPED